MVVCEKWEIWFNLIIFNLKKKRRERNYRRNDGECCRWSTPADLEDPSWPSDREAGPVRAAPEVRAVQPAEVPEISETATECRRGWRPSNHRPTTPRTSPAVPKIWVRVPALTNEKKFIPNDPSTSHHLSTLRWKMNLIVISINHRNMLTGFCLTRSTAGRDDMVRRRNIT